MPYRRPYLPLVAPAIVARRVEEPPVEQPASHSDQPRAMQTIDMAGLAERVYRLMLHDALSDQERSP